MKKFFKEHDLLKASGLFILLAVLLTWVIPYGYYQEGGMVKDEINRVGLTNFMQQDILGFSYFPMLVSFLLILGGFYELISRTAGYQSMVDKICKKIKGHETVFVLVISFIFALMASTMNEYFPILIFVPFVITILNRLKIDKLPAFTATFGGILVGIMGATTSSKTVGYINNVFQTDIGTHIAAKIALFVCSFALLAFLTVRQMKEDKKDKKFTAYDKFDIEKVKSPKKKATVWPYIVGLILIFVSTVLAYLPWSTFEITLFDDITKSVNEFTIFGSPVLNYIFGDFTAFGKWDIFTIQYVMLTVVILIKLFGRVTFDEIIESFATGFKKIGPSIITLLFVYTTLVFAATYPVVPVIVDWICNITKGFSSILSFIAVFITSIFGVEMQYIMSLSGTYFAGEAAKHVKELAIIFQSAFGLACFFVPTSAILMLGLSFLEIPYGKYFRFIWKLLAAMLVIAILIIIII